MRGGELLKLTDKMLDKYDDHPFIYYGGNIYWCFRKFKPVTRAEHGRGANEENNFLEYGVENCYIPGRKGCFLKCFNNIFKKDCIKENFEFIQSYKRRSNAKTRCILPEISVR